MRKRLRSTLKKRKRERSKKKRVFRSRIKKKKKKLIKKRKSRVSRRLAPKRKRKRKKIRPRRKARIKKRIIRRGPRTSIFLPEKIEALFEKGKKRGFVTISEILDFFPKAERDIKGLERLYEDLEKAGIGLKEAREFLETKEEVLGVNEALAEVNSLALVLVL